MTDAFPPRFWRRTSVPPWAASGSTNGTVRTSCRRPTRAVRRVSHWLPELTHIPMSGRLRTGGHRLRIPSHLLCEVPLRAGAWSEAGSSSDQPTTARG